MRSDHLNKHLKIHNNNNNSNHLTAQQLAPRESESCQINTAINISNIYGGLMTQSKIHPDSTAVKLELN